MNKHLFFPILTTLFLIIFLSFSGRPVCSGSRAFSRFAAAASAHHTDIRHAKTLQKDHSYNTTAAAGDFHYYCLLSSEKDSKFTIQIHSSEKISLSFQLYDQKGNLYPPSNYSLDPVRYLLTIEYDIPAGKSWLLGLCNNKDRSFSYAIKYSSKTNTTSKKSSQNHSKNESVNDKAPTNRPAQNPSKKIAIKNTASPQNNAKNNNINNNTRNNNINKKKSLQNQSKKNAANSKTEFQNSTVKNAKNKQNVISASNNNTSKQTAISASNNTKNKQIKKPVCEDSKHKQTAKLASKNHKHKPNVKSTSKPIPSVRLSISDTFLQTKCGNTLTLNASVSSGETCHIQWLFSSGQFVKKKTIHTGKNSSTLTLSTCQKGVYIVTCKIREYKNVSASCTIKIT